MTARGTARALRGIAWRLLCCAIDSKEGGVFEIATSCLILHWRGITVQPLLCDWQRGKKGSSREAYVPPLACFLAVSVSLAELAAGLLCSSEHTMPSGSIFFLSPWANTGGRTLSSPSSLSSRLWICCCSPTATSSSGEREGREWEKNERRVIENEWNERERERERRYHL